MTRAEALELNKKYRLSNEVKEILRSEGLCCHIFVAYDYLYLEDPVCYGIDIDGYYEAIEFSEIAESDNAFDRHARSVLREFGIIAP